MTRRNFLPVVALAVIATAAVLYVPTYWPKASATDASWTPPAFEKVN